MQERSAPMTEGSIGKRIVLFALPIFLGNLFQQMYNTADSLIVGNFLGSNALAAVSSSGSLIFMLIGFLSGVSIGAGVVIARYFGAGDHEDMGLAIHTTVAFGLAASVVMTRTGDKDVSLSDRAALANRLEADLFLSVHCNVSETNPKAMGVYTAYHGGSAESRRAAMLLKDAMVSAAGVPDMGAHDRSDLAVLRLTKMPAVLLECGFMSTPEELELLRQPEHQRALSQGAARGTALFFRAAA